MAAKGAADEKRNKPDDTVTNLNPLSIGLNSAMNLRAESSVNTACSHEIPLCHTVGQQLECLKTKWWKVGADKGLSDSGFGLRGKQ
jgi:hypothetical protein